MKKIVKYAYAVLITCIVLVMVSCEKKENDTISKEKEEIKISSKEILQKTVDYYKKLNVKSVNAVAQGSIKVFKSSEIDLNYNILIENIFNSNNISYKNSKFTLKTNFNNKEVITTIYCLKDGSVAFSLNNKTAFDINSIKQMFGIKLDIPPCTKIIELPTQSPMPGSVNNTLNATESVSASEMPTATIEPSNMQTSSNQSNINTKKPSKMYTLDNMVELEKYLEVLGKKNIDDKEAYVLRGYFSNNQIINGINNLIDSNLYMLPNKYGNFIYNICIDTKTYEIVTIELDIGEIVQNLASGVEKIDTNVITFRLSINQNKKINMPSVRKLELGKNSYVWNRLNYYGNVFKKMNPNNQQKINNKTNKQNKINKENKTNQDNKIVQEDKTSKSNNK